MNYAKQTIEAIFFSLQSVHAGAGLLLSDAYLTNRAQSEFLFFQILQAH